MTEETRILVRLLASTDAVFLPLRNFDPPKGANRYFARRDFGKGGVPWESGGQTAAGRKTAQIELEGLAESGMVTVCRPRGIKTLGVKLTDNGEREARKIVGLPGLFSGWLSASELAKYSKRPAEAEFLTDLWTAEAKLFGDVPRDEFPREAVRVEEELLSALVRGLVLSDSDCEGRASYRLDPSGWAWLDSGDVPADDMDGADPEARDLYYEHVKAALHRLDTADPVNKQELGMIGLPVAIEGIPLPACWKKRTA